MIICWEDQRIKIRIIAFLEAVILFISHHDKENTCKIFSFLCSKLMFDYLAHSDKNKNLENSVPTQFPRLFNSRG